MSIGELSVPDWWTHVRGAVGKSLARPERKQATATKLGIYSTYSPRSGEYVEYVEYVLRPLL